MSRVSWGKQSKRVVSFAVVAVAVVTMIAYRAAPPPDGELLPAVIDASAPLLSDEHAPVEALMRAD